MNPDRRVHAKVPIPVEAGPEFGGEFAEIVRYERAGKWYYESPVLRRQLALDEAVQFVEEESQVQFGVPGGSAFDRRVREKFGAADTGETE